MPAEQRTCQNCQTGFAIDPEDLDFYKKMAVPPPTWCPECRLVRRLIWRNERAFYKRKCDLCGQEMIAMHPADAPYPVYCRSCWFSDKWDGTEYGRDYDLSRPFFEQFRELLQVVPQVALQVAKSVDCEYTNQIANCKNCYLITSGSDNEDCMYSFRIMNSRNVVDSLVVLRLDSCYECSQCLDSARTSFSERVTDVVDCSFCYDVRGSQNCFMSSNLRTSSYVFRNEQLNKEEYDKRMSKIDTGSYKALQEYKREFEELKLKSIHKYRVDKKVVNFSGDSAANVKDCKQCFWISDAEKLGYCLMLNDAKDAYDVNNGCCVMELVYETSTVGLNAYNVRFSADAWPEARNTTYCQSCRDGSNNLFGCVSLRKKEYCILNKQYSKEEYEELVGKIIPQMDDMPYTDSKGRVYKFGEFFPPELSLFAYNESPAQDFFPLSRKDAEAQGFRWREPEEHRYQITLKPQGLPDHIKDTPDSMTSEVIGCLHEGKCEHQCTDAFRIIPQELRFYRQMKVTLPRLCPNCRHHERLEKKNPFRLWHRSCMCRGGTSVEHFHGSDACPNEFETSYPPDGPEIVYCEECYNAEVA